MPNTNDLVSAVNKAGAAVNGLIASVHARVLPLRQAFEANDTAAIGNAISQLEKLTADANKAAAEIPNDASDVGAGGVSVANTPPVDASGLSQGAGAAQTAVQKTLAAPLPTSPTEGATATAQWTDGTTTALTFKVDRWTANDGSGSIDPVSGAWQPATT